MLVRMMKIINMRAPAGFLTRFVFCMTKDKIPELEYVLEYIVSFSDEFDTFLDEYYKTFKRKKLIWLFPAATIKIF